MNWVDYLIIAIIVISSIIGIVRGFVKEVLSLVSWAIAIWVAMTFYLQTSEMLTEYIATPSIRTFAAFLGLFLVTLIVGAIINHLISKLVEKTGLSGTDRMLGIIFGLLRGGAIIIILILLARTTPMPSDPWWQASASLGYFEPYAEMAHGYLPDNIGSHISFEDPAATTAADDAVITGSTDASVTPDTATTDSTTAPVTPDAAASAPSNQSQ